MVGDAPTRPSGPARRRPHLRADRVPRRRGPIAAAAAPRPPDAWSPGTTRATCSASCASSTHTGRACSRPGRAGARWPRGRRRPLLRLRRHCSASSCPRSRWPWPTRSWRRSRTATSWSAADASCLVHLRTRAAAAGRTDPRPATWPRSWPTALPDDRGRRERSPSARRTRCASRTAGRRGRRAAADQRRPRRRPLRIAPRRGAGRAATTPTASAHAARAVQAAGPRRPARRCSSGSPTQVVAAGGHVYWAADRAGRRAATSLEVVPAPRRRPGGREVEVDGHRGDRPQRGARGRRRSRSSRPTSASGSSSSPARRRATSSPRRCTTTATRSHDLFVDRRRRT